MIILCRILLLLGAALLCLAFLFVLAAAWLPRHEVKQGDDPTRIYVLSNGFHSDIAIPVAHFDRLGLSLDDFPVARNNIRYLAVGWGSMTAYTTLRDVPDLTLGIIVKAAAFDETVVHVQPLGELTPGDGIYAFDLADEQLEALLERLRKDFETSNPIPNLTQGFGGRFYESNGRFSAWRTCNTWTGEHLRAIGLPVGFWTPSAWSLEYGLRRSDQSM